MNHTKNVKTSSSLVLVAIATLTLSLAATACSGSSARQGGDPGLGSVGVALQIGAGTTISSVSYSIAGPLSFMKSGTINVSDSDVISAVIEPIPAGTGFSIALSAASTDGATTCAGTAPFDVTAHQTTSVTVHLTCHQAVRTGSVLVNGSLNVCPIIDGVSASPAEVFVGSSIALAVQARDLDQGPSPLTYLWTANSGQLSDPTAQNPQFTCISVGTATITLSVSDGDSAPGCADTISLTVTCTAAGSAAGTGGASGVGGAGTGGIAGTGGVIGTGGTVGTGGATGVGGTVGTGGATGVGGATGAAGANNLVIYRVGDGAGALVNTGNPVFVDEYTVAGALVGTTAMPTTSNGANHRLVASGTATSEGLITLSADGRFVVLTGYDAAIPAATSLPGTSSTATPRTIGRLDAAGNVDTTTALTDAANANNPRSGASTDGVNFWLTGAAGGIRFATLGGATSVQLSTTVTNLRQVGIFAGQLYVSDSSGSAVRLGAVGTGLPTTAGQTITNLSGIPGGTGSPYGFFFADLDPATPGVDVVYVADDSSGLTKYSLTGGVWTANGTLGTAADAYRGLTGVVSGSSVALYATRDGGSGATGGGQLVSVLDSSGPGGAFTATPALLATAAANTAFRGIALAPQP